MTNARVLVVDDDAIMATHLNIILEQAGNEVVGLAASGEEAITQAGTSQPDIILMDIRLRGPMTGIEASAKIRERWDIPIVYLTAYSNDALLAEAKQTEPFGFLVKPVREKELIAVVEMAIYKHKTERRLVHVMSVMRAVRGINRLITHTYDPMKLLDRACKILYGSRGYSLVWIAPLDSSSSYIQPCASAGENTSYLSRWNFDFHDANTKDGPVITAARTGLPVVCNDIASNQVPQQIIKIALENGFRSGAVIPMVYQKRVFGVIAVYADRINAFDKEEITLLQELAEDLAYGLKAIEEETVRKRVEQSLRESEERYRTVANFNYDWEYWIEPDGKWVYCSPSCERITGYPPEQFMSDPDSIYRIIFEEDRETIRQHQAPYLGWSDPIDLRIVRKDGEIRWINHVCHNIYDDKEIIVGVRCSNRDITDRKRAENALRESEERYRSIIETASEGIVFIDKEKDIVFANPRMADLLGYDLNEMIGHAYTDFFYKEDVADLEAKLAIRQKGVSDRFERRLRRKDGTALWTLLSATPIYNSDRLVCGAFGMFTDITELKQAEAQLKRRITDLEVIYENGLALGKILEPKEIGRKIIEILTEKIKWHHVMIRFLNYKTNKLELMAYKHIDASIEDVYQQMENIEDFINTGHDLRAWIFNSRVSELNNDFIKEARYIPSIQGIKSGLFVPVNVDAKVIGIIYIASHQENAFDQDDLRLVNMLALQAGIALENARLYQTAQAEVTMRKQIEGELLVLNQQLEQRVTERTEELRIANAALEHSSRMKDEFLASMSHELRTPLTGVLNLSEVLQEQVYGPLNEKQIQFLQTIESSGRHLLGLINDILDLSKIEAGQFELQVEPCSVADICQSSLQLIRGMAYKKNQSISFNIDPTNMVFNVDARRIKQMLVNLLSNAVKFTPDGGKIGLQVEGDERLNEMRFTVSDTGIGIAQEDMIRLFKPFTQLDSRLSRTHSGTGLGLALVKRMADFHYGTVSVKSKLGEGSQFIVTLPWKTIQHKEEDQSASQTSGTADHGSENSAEPSRGLILIADDNEMNLNIYADYLRIKGYQVIMTQRGEDAVKLAHEQRPDLILMDIQMPGMDGLTAIHHIRNSNGHAVPIPIIALTALAMMGDRERCLAAGADDYLSKPISLQDLIGMIQKYLQKARSYL